jgi:hypothetical protein
MPDSASTASRRNRRVHLVLAALALLAFGGVAATLFVPRPAHAPPPVGPLDAQLTVTVWKTAAKQPHPVGAAGALPVQAGDWIDVEARYNQPAHTYLLWFDARGKVIPLYPWNIDAIEATDLSKPPSSLAAKVVFSPMTIGKGWPVDSGSGLETVLLLASRTPLEPSVQLSNLVGPLPVPPLRDPLEFAQLALDRGSDHVIQVAGREPDAAVADRDAALELLMRRLALHFESIRAVRFAHREP